MAVLGNKDGTSILVDCDCGCDDGIRIRIDKEDDKHYCFLTYTNGKFYSEQCETFKEIVCKKLRKIWAIIMNKDYYYSDIIMSQDDFEEFKEFINRV